MSIDSADLDNDLQLEIYIAQISGDTPTLQERFETRPAAAVCEELEDPGWRERCLRELSVHAVLLRSLRAHDVTECRALADPLARGDCIAYQMLTQAASGQKRDRTLCGRFPARWEPFAFICDASFSEPAPRTTAERDRAIPQILHRNVLLAPSGEGHFVDRAEELGVDVAGWTWNAKFADLDNDEWQDLYAVNGNFRLPKREANLFFRNREGRGFTVESEASGLGSYLSTGSYAYVDFDNDGDLDIIEVPFAGPIWVYRNGEARHGSVIFELRDGIGNSHGIGSRIVIHYGPAGERHQVREIKASGGYVSFDPPEAHFGLGEHGGVERVEVFWSTGERSELRGELAAGQRYRISRSARP